MSAEIIRGLPSGQLAHAYPLIEEGLAFKGLSEVVGPRSHVPSQGWRHARWSVLRDIAAIAATIPPAIGFLRGCYTQYDRVVVVGDTSAVILGAWAGLKIDFYIDVFKTGYAHRYSPLDLWAIKRTTRKVFCRDGMLAGQLLKRGIDAVSFGNIMLDTITYADIKVDRPHDRSVVGLLPGSRDTTPAAFAIQIDALERVALSIPVLGVAALASGIDPISLARMSNLEFHAASQGNPQLAGRLEGRGLYIELYRNAAGNVIEASDVLLSQAGTATQQALGLGKPVITFFPPQHRKKRMDDEQKLMGEARRLLPPDPALMAKEILRLLRDPDERERLGKIGRERLGGPGTLEAVLRELGGPS